MWSIYASVGHVYGNRLMIISSNYHANDDDKGHVKSWMKWIGKLSLCFTLIFFANF